MAGVKKNELKPYLRECWCIPPEQDADFVAHMEDVLDLYQLPYNPKRPVVCMDEQPKQLLKEKLVPIEAACGRPGRYDYEYERNGRRSSFCLRSRLGDGGKLIPESDELK